jgi:hypothetical protein
MFHVEQRFDSGNRTLENELFHVKRCSASSLEIRGQARCSTWNTDSPLHLHLQISRTLPFETLYRRGADSECSTWNIDLARAANGCESGEFIREIAGTSPL